MTRRSHALATVIALALTTLVIVSPARAAGPVQPGVRINTEVGGCTLAWLFQRVDVQSDGTTTVNVFGSTAAHCVSSVGQTVTDGGGDRIGQVAFMGNADEEGRDYAFIAIDPARYGDINPAMAGHPDIPTGLSTAPQEGDLMQFSGHGVGFDATQPTREERVGILNWHGDREHAVTGIVLFGDSGGPVADIDEGNTAYGIVNTVGGGVNGQAMTVVMAGEGGANLTFVLADAAANGFNPGDLCIAGQPCGSAG